MLKNFSISYNRTAFGVSRAVAMVLVRVKCHVRGTRSACGRWTPECASFVVGARPLSAKIPIVTRNLPVISVPPMNRYFPLPTPPGPSSSNLAWYVVSFTLCCSSPAAVAAAVTPTVTCACLFAAYLQRFDDDEETPRVSCDAPAACPSAPYPQRVDDDEGIPRVSCDAPAACPSTSYPQGSTTTREQRVCSVMLF
jgi:hypothetical protein